MTITTRYDQVSAHDGGTFDAYCAVPASGRGPGTMLFQEIFGINDNMRGLAERLAGEGYSTRAVPVSSKYETCGSWPCGDVELAG